jgi:transposase
MAQKAEIDLFFSDESRVNLQPYVPYGWQLWGESDEEVTMPSTSGGGINCFASISRDNRIFSYLTQGYVNSQWIIERLDALSFELKRTTIVVLDNASLHVKAVKECAAVWEQRGLLVWFLPKYSPHLNLAEVLWRKLKYEWLCASDYADEGSLHFAVWKVLHAVGDTLHINFSTPKIRPFKIV